MASTRVVAAVTVHGSVYAFLNDGRVLQAMWNDGIEGWVPASPVPLDAPPMPAPPAPEGYSLVEGFPQRGDLVVSASGSPDAFWRVTHVEEDRGQEVGVWVEHHAGPKPNDWGQSGRLRPRDVTFLYRAE